MAGNPVRFVRAGAVLLVDVRLLQLQPTLSNYQRPNRNFLILTAYYQLETIGQNGLQQETGTLAARRSGQVGRKVALVPDGFDIVALLANPARPAGDPRRLERHMVGPCNKGVESN